MISREQKKTCYCQHHPVFKETSTTTKTRVVFDGGAKISNGLSLTDILQVGPTVRQDLYSIVLRFRIHQVCFTADIAKMYRQIVNIQKTSHKDSPKLSKLIRVTAYCRRFTNCMHLKGNRQPTTLPHKILTRF